MNLWQFRCTVCEIIWYMETTGERPDCHFCPKCGGKIEMWFKELMN
jgi:rRNA maturation endonuclease Nob1